MQITEHSQHKACMLCWAFLYARGDVERAARKLQKHMLINMCGCMTAVRMCPLGVCKCDLYRAGKVRVETIYEPPQSGTPDSLSLERGTEEEQRADYLAGSLG